MSTKRATVGGRGFESRRRIRELTRSGTVGVGPVSMWEGTSPSLCLGAWVSGDGVKRGCFAPEFGVTGQTTVLRGGGSL